MGVSIAWQLARRLDPHEEPVVLLEKKELGAGESGRSGAIVRQFYTDREVAAMARDSLRAFQGFEARTGRSIGWMPSGVLTLGSRAKAGEAELLERNVAMMRALAIDVELLDAAAIQKRVPGIAVSDATLGAWEPGAGAVDPMRVVHAFAALAREEGAATRIGERVEELLVEDGALTGVRTGSGTIECDQCVVAAGPWTRALLAGVGVELPLRVVRPEQHFLALPRGAGASARTGPTASLTVAGARSTLDAELLARFAAPSALEPAPHPVLLDLELGFYARCDLVGERTRVGRMDYHADRTVEDPDDLDELVSAELREWARAVLVQRMPRYASEPDVASQAAMYTLTPDAQALLGPVTTRDGPIEGLFVASGFSGHGFKLSPSIGEGMAQMLTGEPISAFDARFFTPDRSTVRSGAFGL
jgi:glycine/D-amino acid oxidase-like deaminating enzyme